MIRCGCARMRELSVRRKLNAMPAVFAGKRVLLVDDSIVRSTTMSQIVDMVRRAGASKARPCAFLPLSLTFISSGSHAAIQATAAVKCHTCPGDFKPFSPTLHFNRVM